ncbi:hypothetical protein V8L40_002656 [Listeria monocytogenes]|uniref:hypothetical protein n=1 Tax=Listeria monocytogenes TaxID=1639 RepID=UPI0010B80C4E|nr:hypothetical protein [Listeria monocytogenes]EAC4247953.1 hypothetical protein [Listeria monocytogenes]EAE4158365.1 hypothetical protein [Listeria monocytogenes]EAH1140478.1 hypothetical protein [Listeria monocytogenes]EIN2603750.1 hypothetical protein [Listeria monocytogenes]EIO3384774.1 hypothetical protein [Listeria monocytogenes]
MTKKSIEEVKFEEAEKLADELHAIAMFNENITCLVNVSYNEEESINTTTFVAGKKNALLAMYELMKGHDCMSNVVSILEAGKDGTMAGFNKFTKEAKEQTNENN